MKIYEKELAKALYIINKAAKQGHDFYEAKDAVINKLFKKHSLRYLGYTVGWRWNGVTTYLRTYKFCGISFHQPTEDKPKGKRMKPLGFISPEIDKKKAGGMELPQAIGIIRKFINN